METASPNPFVGQNGHGHAAAHFDDDEDFGPETDVDMVDDVLLSPAIAAAKALVSSGKDNVEDDYERQRQQLSEFDDPGDLDKSRDTPTPPAHEVVNNANADNLAESGGEESEEEWNYIPGKDTKSVGADTQDQEDMSSQLNPNAAEFVPVSPTRLMMLDDAIISASPSLGFEKSMDNIQLPSEKEFGNEISQRPGDLEFSNGLKHGDDYFMRDNFSTLRNKGKDFKVPTSGSELSEDKNTLESGNIPFDKLETIQNIEEKVSSEILEKANFFGPNINDFSNNAFSATNIFGKSDPMTTSVIGLKDLEHSPDLEESVVPSTPKSTTVEAPVSPVVEDVPPLNHQEDLDSPSDELLMNIQKSPDVISPGDGPQEGLISGQERTSSSGFESESGTEEGETNVVEENNDGFVTEHRKSPPLDLSFKPIQTFSDTNPFGALQTPSSTTPLDNFELLGETKETSESQLVTPEKCDVKNFITEDFTHNTPSSFISLRPSATDDIPVPFDQLESPKDIPHFEHPPNANSSFLDSELQNIPEHQNTLENMLGGEPEHSDPTFDSQRIFETNVNDVTQDLFPEEANPEFEETSFTTENTTGKDKQSFSSHIDLDTTENFVTEESKIIQDEHECEQKSKLEEETNCGDQVKVLESNIIPCELSAKNEDQQLIGVLSDISNDHAFVSSDTHHEEKVNDFETETKEMKLEFESHIAHSDQTPEEFKNIDDGFEVISKEELTLDENTVTPHVQTGGLDIIVPTEQLNNVDLLSPSKQINPFMVDQEPLETKPVPEVEKPIIEAAIESKSSQNLFSAIDDFSSELDREPCISQNTSLLSSSKDQSLEPEATKTVSYQTLIPADEPKLTKTESYVTGVKEEKLGESLLPEGLISDVAKTEESIIEKEKDLEAADTPVIMTKSEPVQSQVVTETLITALEETSEVPSVATTDVPSTVGTPPPTPAPGLDDDKEDSSKTDILVAAVAAAGAVAAGSAIVAEKESKKPTSTAVKKPAVTATKKPSDVTSKVSGKPVSAKAPAAKPAAKTTPTTTTKTAPAATKSTTTTAVAKTAAVKTNAAPALKKTTPSTTSKPLAAKSTTTAASKPTSTSAKPVPKQLPVNKTTPTTLKPSSKASTPTSKPTTPTTPKSPLKHDLVKSPAPIGKSTLTASKTAGSDKPIEKKPLLNGDMKPLAKKSEVLVKKPTTTTATTKTSITSKSTTPPVKSAVSSAKASTTTAAKTTTKPTSASTQPKPKPATTTAAKPAPTVTKRPTSATALKTADKTVKETANKQISNTKPAVNGKTAPAKTTGSVKKTDVKLNGKTPPGKPAPIKKPEHLKIEEAKPAEIQEDNVTTTNGFAEHIIETHESTKVEELAPVIVEGVN